MGEHLAHDTGKGFAGKLTHDHPAHARGRRRQGADRSGVDNEPQGKVGEGVRDKTGKAMPFRLGTLQTRSINESIARIEVPRPFAGWHLGHAAKQSVHQAPAQKDRMVGAPNEEGRAVPQMPLLPGRFARKRFLVAPPVRPAILHPWTVHAGRILWRADGRAEVHQRLCKIAGSPRRQETFGEPPYLRPGSRQFRFDRKEPREYPLTVAVNCRRAFSESDGRYRGRAIWADAGERAKLGFAFRKMPAVAHEHSLSAGVKVSRPRVIAKPRPHLEHVIDRGLRERAHNWPARSKAHEIWCNRLHRGLLQHDFGEPNPIGVGFLARQGAPREDAAMAIIPMQERR